MKKGFIRWSAWAVSGIFILADTLTLYLVFRLSFFVRQITPLSLFDRKPFLGVNQSLMELGILLSVGVFFIQDLYPGYGLTAVKELEKMGRAVSLSFFLLASISYFNKPFQDFSRAILLFGWVFTLVTLPLVHFILRNILSRFSWYGVPVVIFGDGAWGQQIATSLKRVRRLGWYPAAIRPVEAIQHPVKDTQFEVAILALSTGASVDKYARILNQNYRKVILIRKADNFGSLWIEPRDLDGNLGLEFHYHLFDGQARWVKRLVDFVFGLTLSILISPILAILCLLIILDSPGPIFFYQERLGKDFRRFNMIKFRTMMMDAEQRLSNILKTNSVARAEYEKYHKLTNDPRLTRVGKWLRRFSLDELPQMWNMLKGEMSLVGPRAYMPSELTEIGDYAPTILRIQPGLTGWWQVMGRHQTTFQQRLRMDEYYISNWSLWMDFYIMLKTVWVVIGGKGA